MGKRISACLIILLTALMVVGPIYHSNFAIRAIEETAAVRDFIIPPDGIVYIDPEAVALAGVIDMADPRIDKVIADINDQRAAAGLGALTKKTDLVAAATVRAKEQEQLFSHTRPNGQEWWTVNSNVCYGECLSKGYSPENVTIAWMNSPTHKAVIMDGSYKTVGIGIYTTDAGIVYIALETGY